MLFITTRGGSYENNEMEMGVRTLKAMAKFFGIKKFIAYGVDGMDEGKVPVEELLNKAKRELKELAKNFQKKLRKPALKEKLFYLEKNLIFDVFIKEGDYVSTKRTLNVCSFKIGRAHV